MTNERKQRKNLGRREFLRTLGAGATAAAAAGDAAPSPRAARSGAQARAATVAVGRSTSSHGPGKRPFSSCVAPVKGRSRFHSLRGSS